MLAMISCVLQAFRVDLITTCHAGNYVVLAATLMQQTVKHVDKLEGIQKWVVRPKGFGKH